MTLSKDDLDLLFSTALETSTALLERHGAFFPLLFEMRKPGVVKSVAVLDRTDRPNSQTLIESYGEILRPRAASGQIIGTAIAADLRGNGQGDEPAGDAIKVEVRARGHALDMFAPYSLETSGMLRKRRKLMLGEVYAAAAENEIFLEP